VLTEPGSGKPMVFDAAGTRLIATAPQNELAINVGYVRRFRAHDNHAFVLDGETIRAFERLP
jgi:hypothetical protein